MPSLSRSLEQVLHRAIKLASDRHHEYATLEHLLLALLDDSVLNTGPTLSCTVTCCTVDATFNCKFSVCDPAFSTTLEGVIARSGAAATTV